MRRFRTARIRDLRLWLGLSMIVISMVVGARILSSGQDQVQVWQASRDLQAGATPTDLVPVWVGRELAEGAYLPAASPMTGTLRWPLAAGQLLPAAWLSDDVDPNVRAVAVPVESLRLPHVQSGDRVDVWTTDTQEHTPPRLVLADVLVSSVTADTSGVASDLTVLLEVPTQHVGNVVAASRSGAVDLVTVPIAGGAS